MYGQVGIGTINPRSSSALQIDSKTGGLVPPRMTSDERDALVSPLEGMVFYNVTEYELQVLHNRGNNDSKGNDDWGIFGSVTNNIISSSINENITCSLPALNGSVVHNVTLALNDPEDLDDVPLNVMENLMLANDIIGFDPSLSMGSSGNTQLDVILPDPGISNIGRTIVIYIDVFTTPFQMINGTFKLAVHAENGGSIYSLEMGTDDINVAPSPVVSKISSAGSAPTNNYKVAPIMVFKAIDDDLWIYQNCGFLYE